MTNKNYILLDCGDFKKLEQLGPYRFVRPCAAAMWPQTLPSSEWNKCDAEFVRSSGNEGKWHIKRKNLVKTWQIEQAGLQLEVGITDFGHFGIFPEHHHNAELKKAIEDYKSGPFRVLNLFAYTGVLSLLAAKWGAHVVHLDSSKTVVAWAKRNMELSGLSEKPVRFIQDDVKKFVQKELRRGQKYHAIILDPPSFGRGDRGQVWKIEDDLYPLLLALKDLLAPDFKYLQVSAHSPGVTPLSLENMLAHLALPIRGRIEGAEMAIAIASSNRKLPSGVCARFISETL